MADIITILLYVAAASIYAIVSTGIAEGVWKR